MYVAINATDAVNADLQHAIVISCNRTYKSFHLQLCMQKLAIALEYLRVNNCSNVLLFRCNCIQKLTITGVHKMFSVAEVQTKVINCNSENKSCLLQVVHTKAIAALTQFCDF